MLLFCTPFVDRTDLATLDMPHQPSIQEENVSESSPLSSPIKSAHSAAVDTFAATASASSSPDELKQPMSFEIHKFKISISRVLCVSHNNDMLVTVTLHA